MLSVWVLYSMMVLGGRLRTRRSVSRMRAVVAWSLAVLFQMEIMSSCKQKIQKLNMRSAYTIFVFVLRGRTWKRTDTTAPQISSPTMNCSPSMARIRFSQHRDARPFLRRMIHFPPILLASSWNNKNTSFKFALQNVRKKGQFSSHKPNTNLPHGFNTLFKEVEVAMTCQVTWADHVTVKTPELLHLKSDDNKHEVALKKRDRDELWLSHTKFTIMDIPRQSCQSV